MERIWMVGVVMFWACSRILAQVDFPACTNRTEPTCRCNTAPVICSIDELNGAVLRMSTFRHAADGPNPLCPNTQSVPDNPSWMGFTAWCTNLTLRFTLNNCRQARSGLTWNNGVQVAVFSACGPPNNQYQSAGCLVDANIVCCTGFNCTPPNNLTLNLNNLVIGQVYYLLVDGCAGAACDVTIQVVNNCGRERILPWPSPIAGPDTLCSSNDGASYLIQPPQSGLTYSWYLDGNLVQRNAGNQIAITDLSPGSHQLCVDVSKEPCVPESEPPLPMCKEIWVAEVIPENPPELSICTGDSIFFMNQFYTAGTFIIPLQTDYGCDSTIQLKVSEVQQSLVSLGSFRVCKGDSLQIAGSWFQQSGDYTVNLSQSSPPFCDSTIIFSIQIIDLEDIEDIVLNCIIDPIAIIPAAIGNMDSLRFSLFDSADQEISTGDTLFISEAGRYRILLFDEVSSCSLFSNWFEIIDAGIYPTIQWEAPEGLILNCSFDSILIRTLPQNDVEFYWQGNFGETRGDSLRLYFTDQILITALDTLSGCSSQELIQVTIDTLPPVFELQVSDPISCLDTLVELSLKWINDKPDSFSTTWLNTRGEVKANNVEILSQNEGGVMIVRVVNNLNGCVWLDSVDVLDQRTIPQVRLEGDFFISCDKPVANIRVVSDALDARTLWSLNNSPLPDIEGLINVDIDLSGQYTLVFIDNTNGCSAELHFEIENRVIYPELEPLEVGMPGCNGQPGFVKWAEEFQGIVLVNREQISGKEFFTEEPGVYSFRWVNAFGCAVDTTIILVVPEDLVLQIPLSFEIELGDSVFISPVVNRDPGQLRSILWEPPGGLSCAGCLEPIASPFQTIAYTLSLLDTFGCTGSATVRILVTRSDEIFVPDAFTPDGNGLNDRLVVFAGKHISEIVSFEVFDRWGSRVHSAGNFRPGDTAAGWDGKFRGKSMDPGVFIYQLTAKLIDGNVVFRSGGSTLIR